MVQFIDEFFVRDRLFIVMEFVPCNLLELLEAQPGGMDREAVRLIMYQLCTVITFIHAKVGGGWLVGAALCGWRVVGQACRERRGVGWAGATWLFSCSSCRKAMSRPSAMP